MTGRPVVFDSSIYIPYLRGQAYVNLMEPTGRAARARLSAVVIAELYAGTRSARDKADLDAVVRAYRSLGFLLEVTTEDWIRAGQAIRRYTRLVRARRAARASQRSVDPGLEWSSGGTGGDGKRGDLRSLGRMGCPVRVAGIRREDYLD